MITLIRWFLLQQKKIKFELMFYTLIDKSIKKISTEEFKDNFLKEIMPYIATLVHEQANENNKTE